MIEATKTIGRPVRNYSCFGPGVCRLLAINFSGSLGFGWRWLAGSCASISAHYPSATLASGARPPTGFPCSVSSHPSAGTKVGCCLDVGAVSGSIYSDCRSLVPASS